VDSSQHVIPALHFQPRNKGGRMLGIFPDPRAVNNRVHTHRVTDATTVNSSFYPQHGSAWYHQEPTNHHLVKKYN